MQNLTSNQYWGAINRRFDAREALLYRFGFRAISNEFGTFYVRQRSQIQKDIVPFHLIAHSHNRVWRYYLKKFLKRV